MVHFTGTPADLRSDDLPRIDGGSSTVMIGATADRPGAVIDDRVEAIDVVFPVLHGPWGEDGTIQGLLDFVGVPYVGSGVLASAMCMDKITAKVHLRAAGISVAEWVAIDSRSDVDAAIDRAMAMSAVLFVKPSRAGSSVGITRVNLETTGRNSLAQAVRAARVHDPRVIWSTEAAIAAGGGEAVCAKTGHAYIKAAMREHNALYGGEMSAHHYFRDFHYCDSGMIPWLLIAERLSATGQKLSELIAERRAAHPSSGERNFTVENADVAIARVVDAFEVGATLDETDGVSLEFADWRFNLRKSNTEPLVRLNVEARGGAVDIEARVAAIAGVLLGEAGRR